MLLSVFLFSFFLFKCVSFLFFILVLGESLHITSEYLASEAKVEQTEEYTTILFSWYFKGFELLKRYFIKHPSGVDLEKLDLEEVDKEMAADEAAQSSAAETDAPENALESGGAAANA